MFFGVGKWFVNAYGMEIGPVFTTFLFQLSFATTATTIVSGGIAERYQKARIKTYESNDLKNWN